MQPETCQAPSPAGHKKDSALPALEVNKPRRGAWLRLLSEVLHLAGASGTFVRHHERAWSSATFIGARHEIVLCFDGEEAVAQGEAFIAALPEHEFTIAGQIVADACVVAVEHTLAPHPHMTVEAAFLLIKEC